MFGDWNKVPKGGDDQLRLAARYFFFGVLGLGGLIGVLYIWKLLADFFDEESKADKATEVVSNTFQWLGNQLSSWIPVVIIFAVIIIAGIVATRLMTKSHYRKRAEEQIRYLRILPCNDITLDLDKVDELTRTFGGMVRPVRMRLRYGRPWFRLRFALPEGSKEIGIYLAYPGDKENSVKDTLRSVYPSAELHDISADQFPGPDKGGSGGHFVFKIGQNQGLPLASLRQKKQSHLGSILNCLRPGTYLDLQFSPVSWKEVEERTEDAVDDLKRKKTKDMDPEERSRRVSLVQRFTGRELSFHVRLSIWSNSDNAVSVVRSTAESIETAMKYDGAVQFIRHDWWNPLMDHNLVPIPYPWTIMTWTGDEIANLFHIPPANHYIYQEAKEDGPDTRGFIVHLENNQRSLKPDEWNEGVLIGKIHHPLEKREVRVHYEQLSKHFILTGASGMGKSSLAVEMIQSILDEWFENHDEAPGFTIIDPAREIIPIIENRLRIAERVGINIPKEKIHHFNLTHDATHVPALNLLHKVEGISTNQLAEQMTMVLVTDEETDEPLSRSKRLMAMAIQSLLEDTETHTILGIDDIFRNKPFRNKVIQNVKDPYVKRFWANVDEAEMKREADQVLNRIDHLLQSPTMRRLFCQKKMNLDIAKYMDEGHLVMIDTYGLKDYDITVTVGQLINQYYQVARKRATGSKFHLMMVDEAHLVQIPLLTEILQEDRKYPFGLGLITREIDHFKNETLMQAIRSNIGMVLSCGQTEGSDEVESITRKHIKSSFLEKLPERHAAVYIRSKRRQRSDVTTCVVQNDPPVVYHPDGKEADHRNKEKDEALLWGLEWGLEIMKSSPEVRPIEEVDREIAEYMDQSLFFDKRSESAN
ncbi:hypothetical protein [Laceyella putida]|uniref:ATP-binding protein n=1 Tax=Laceyella putida TaxID=110101 RepID=A0ABW2RQH1_9BACL